MITFESGGQLVEQFSELPAVPSSIEHLFADFETSSGDPKLMAVNPHTGHCSAIGAAVSFGLDAPTHFVPRHLMITGWWSDVLMATKRWVNHNIKFDAHVSATDLGLSPKSSTEMICTVNDAKLVDSDRQFKGGYGLDVLSKQWCDFDIDKFGLAMVPYLAGNKDYGRIPIDILAEYACIDIKATKALYSYIKDKMPEESLGVQYTEHRVTRLLFEMEQRGILVNPTELKKAEMRTLIKMYELDAQMDKLAGRSFLPTSSKDCYDILCNQFGLPVLAWTEPTTETGVPGPSFDKNALKLYKKYPGSPKDLINAMIEYRKCENLRSLFLEKWQEIVDPRGRMHATYNQSVRTGRMSCSDPNLQQLSKIAKTLIIPPEGYGIVVADYSQIEFRIIVHYTENKNCIDAYVANPWTDFHQYVADSVPCPREPAKTINFMMGYGGGKKKTVATLAINEDFVGDIIKEVDASGVRPESRGAMIQMLCEQRALKIYNEYHNKLLPELKQASRQASAACRKRGYVRNHYGRRRILDEKWAHKAFNAVCQSGAGDLLKERMVALNDEVPELLQVASVHDEIVGYAPLELLEKDDNLLRRIVTVL